MDRADEHGLLGVFANHSGGLANFDLGQERGFFVKIIGHRGKAGRDNSTDVVPCPINDVEGDGGAEIDDECRSATDGFDGAGIREAIRPDGSWLWIIDADAAQRFGIEFQEIKFEAAEEVRATRRGARDDTAEGGAVELGFADELLDAASDGAIAPARRFEVLLAEDAFGVREADVGVGVADVEEEQHIIYAA